MDLRLSTTILDEFIPLTGGVGSLILLPRYTKIVLPLESTNLADRHCASFDKSCSHMLSNFFFVFESPLALS